MRHHLLHLGQSAIEVATASTSDSKTPGTVPSDESLSADLPESGNLDLLQDIVLPSPPAAFPLEAGLWLLLSIVAGAILFATDLWLKHRRRNAYRSAGLLLLYQVNKVRDIFIALKRVALAAYPRERVATLYGQDWITFLNSTAKGLNLSEWPEDTDKADEKLKAKAAYWMKKHQPERSE